MKKSKMICSALVMGSLALAPSLTLAQPSTEGITQGTPAPKVKKAKRKSPARPPHEDEKSAPTMTKEPPPPPLPQVEPHVPGRNPPPPPGSPPPESM